MTEPAALRDASGRFCDYPTHVYSHALAAMRRGDDGAWALRYLVEAGQAYCHHRAAADLHAAAEWQENGATQPASNRIAERDKWMLRNNVLINAMEALRNI